MPDWTADDIARTIERRRGRESRGTASRPHIAADQISDWSDTDWAEAFRRRHGFNADPRMGKTRVREAGSDGATLFDGEVRVFHLTGQADPWRGYAWCAEENGKQLFVTMVGTSNVKSARDAVRVWLGQLAP